MGFRLQEIRFGSRVLIDFARSTSCFNVRYVTNSPMQDSCFVHFKYWPLSLCSRNTGWIQPSGSVKNLLAPRPFVFFFFRTICHDLETFSSNSTTTAWPSRFEHLIPKGTDRQSSTRVARGAIVFAQRSQVQLIRSECSKAKDACSSPQTGILFLQPWL
jgi:hypothetical protein